MRPDERLSHLDDDRERELSRARSQEIAHGVTAGILRAVFIIGIAAAGWLFVDRNPWVWWVAAAALVLYAAGYGVWYVIFEARERIKVRAWRALAAHLCETMALLGILAGVVLLLWAWLILSGDRSEWYGAGVGLLMFAGMVGQAGEALAKPTARDAASAQPASPPTRAAFPARIEQERIEPHF